MRLLNLGCGQMYHKDWVNVDFVSKNEYVIQHNLLKGIPFGDCEVDVVYHSHVLEHFSKHDGFLFMKECYRVLKANGIIRIVVPDLETIAREYLQNLQLAINGDKTAMENYEWIKLELFDQMVRNESGGEMKLYLNQPIISNENYVFKRIGSEGKIIRETFLNSKRQNEIKKILPQMSKLELGLKKIKRQIYKLLTKRKKNICSSEQNKALKIGEFRLGGEIHQWMYDRHSLSELLKKVGFVDVNVCSAYESKIKNWETYQLDVINGEVRKPDSLFIEASKL